MTFFLSMPFALQAQKDSINIQVRTGALFGKGFTPALLASQQYGRLPVNGKGFFSGLTCKNFDRGKKISLNYALEIYANYHKSSTINMQQGYAELRYKRFKLWGGMREESFGVHDTVLSTGSILWSGNARPVPKFTIETENFVKMPFCQQ
ncbi:MAG: capsule assembly Wzi family protein [Bacteroidales bacterium]|nr:capsule assembly Wzi family protein [Bacteroidales bacterium]